MNQVLELLNLCGQRALDFAWPMFWQSTLLILAILTIDFGFRRRIRPAVLHLLWMLVLVKLLLPPSLALPSGAGWWLRSRELPQPVHMAAPAVVTLDAAQTQPVTATLTPQSAAVPNPTLSLATIAVLIAAVASFGIFLWMSIRCRQMAGAISKSAAAADWIAELAEEVRTVAGLRSNIRVRTIDRAMSPAVFGLFRPTILLPDSLSTHLTRPQLRSILLHEMMHLRRFDVWINCVQSLLQVVYWWHPLLWLANARMRLAREEAVDEEVMLALKQEAGEYAPTLVRVARMALRRPLNTLGLVGILETQSSLKRRVERLLDFEGKRTAGLSIGSALFVIVFGAVAVPMGEAPVSAFNPATTAPASTNDSRLRRGGKVSEVRLLYQAGKLDEANKVCKEAIKLFPNDQALYYYANLISQAKDYGITNSLIRQGRRAIIAKLENTTIDEIAFSGVPLLDVARELSERTRRSDPEHKGINFVLQNSSNPAGEVPGRVANEELARARVHLAVPLREVKLSRVLDAVVKACDCPLRYVIEDYAVVFAPALKESPEVLHTRVFRVDPTALKRRLDELGRSGSGKPSITQQLLTEGRLEDPSIQRQLLVQFLGVEFPPPKSVYYKEKEGTLLVRGTLADLNAIEAGLAQLYISVNIQVRLIEMPDEEGFWASLGTNATSSVEPLTGLLTTRQRSVLLRAIEQNPNADLINLSVTTFSGRQAVMEVTQTQKIATNINPKALTAPGVSKAEEARGEVYVSGPLVFGPTLEVTPWLSADGRAIKLTIKVKVTEFLGFEEQNQAKRLTAYIEGEPKSVSLPMPITSTRQIEATAIVPEQQSLLLAGRGQTANQPNGVAGASKRLILVLTPTPVTPDGKPTWREEAHN